MSDAKAVKLILKEIQQVISDMQFTYSCSSVSHAKVSEDVLRGERGISTQEAIEEITRILSSAASGPEPIRPKLCGQGLSGRSKSESTLAEIRQVMVDMQYSYSREVPAGEEVSPHIIYGDSLVSRQNAVERIGRILDRGPRRVGTAKPAFKSHRHP
ncbi:MAG TPA: hypothetical protein VMD76_05510 [Candidatus Sulfotelmatobacter sp.]|nr:hypothetical protein [Candidatus Sulfotelmatobacter sp.]